MKVMIDKSDRLQRAPRALLGTMRLAERLLKPRGLEYIDLDSILPEMPDYAPFLEQLKSPEFSSPTRAAESEIDSLKETLAEFYGKIYGQPVNPHSETALTPGHRSPVMMLCLGIVNPDDAVGFADPGLAIYRLGAVMAGANPFIYALHEKNDFLPNLDSIFDSPPKKLRLLFLNYPNNPTGAEADLYFYQELAARLRKKNILAVLDCPYTGVIEPGIDLPLQLRHGAKYFLELHSFAFPYGLDGFGFAIGHKGAIAALEQMSEAVGFHPTRAQVHYARLAMQNHDRLAESYFNRIAERRRLLSDGLKDIGWAIRNARHGPFIWAKIPSRATSVGFARTLFIRTGVRARAGSDFGEQGEGHLRISLTADMQTLIKALEIIRKHPTLYRRRGKG